MSLLAVAMATVVVLTNGPALLERPVDRPLHTRASISVVVPEPASEPAQSIWARRVASCESGDGRGAYSLTAENPVSSASGKYQFIKSTWESVTGLPAPASAYPEHVQDAAFEKLWAGGAGWRHWQPSVHCWNHDGAFSTN